MKKFLVVFIGLIMMSSVALASPLTDYSAGKGSVDLTWRNTQDTLNGWDLNKKDNLDSAVTVGLGHNLAFQYRNFEPKSDPTSDSGGVTGTFKLKTNEFNVLYKVDPNFSVIAGVVSAKGEAVPGNNYSSNTKNYWQVGLVAYTPIATKTNLWAVANAGSNLTNLEVGVGYEFACNWEFNVNYRDLETKKLNGNVGNFDAKAKGFGFGVTYKF